jgi:hypothetical protein
MCDICTSIITGEIPDRIVVRCKDHSTSDMGFILRMLGQLDMIDPYEDMQAKRDRLVSILKDSESRKAESKPKPKTLSESHSLTIYFTNDPVKAKQVINDLIDGIKKL